jgi:hypothetical protein
MLRIASVITHPLNCLLPLMQWEHATTVRPGAVATSPQVKETADPLKRSAGVGRGMSFSRYRSVFSSNWHSDSPVGGSADLSGRHLSSF